MVGQGVSLPGPEGWGWTHRYVSVTLTPGDSTHGDCGARDVPRADLGWGRTRGWGRSCGAMAAGTQPPRAARAGCARCYHSVVDGHEGLEGGAEELDPLAVAQGVLLGADHVQVVGDAGCGLVLCVPQAPRGQPGGQGAGWGCAACGQGHVSHRGDVPAPRAPLQHSPAHLQELPASPGDQLCASQATAGIYSPKPS